MTILPAYFPDDGKTPIYYEKITDDLDTACCEHNKERIDWIIATFKLTQSEINGCYFECAVRKNHEIASYIDSLFNVNGDVKDYADELAEYPDMDDTDELVEYHDINNF